MPLRLQVKKQLTRADRQRGRRALIHFRQTPAQFPGALGKDDAVFAQQAANLRHQSAALLHEPTTNPVEHLYILLTGY